MASLSFDKNKVPFLLPGTGLANLNIGLIDPNRPFDPNSPPVFKLGFSGTGTDKIQLGTAQSVKLGVSASANLAITTLFAVDVKSAKLASAQLAGFFADGKN